MNLKDLKNIDINTLRNIDVNDIKDWIKNSTTNFVILILIVITIFATIIIYKSNKGKEVKLKNKLTKYEELEKSIKDNKKYSAEYEKFLENFRKSITGNELVNKLAVFAFNNNVNVESFSPPVNLDLDFMKTTTVELDLSTNNFENIILFIKDIEESPFAMRIDKITAGSEKKGGRRRATYKSDLKSEEKALSTVTISAIELNTKI